MPATALKRGNASRPGLVVWKFGGTSVGDDARLRMVAKRLLTASRNGNRVVAVLSAMGDTTDRLVDLAHEFSSSPPAREFDALVSLGECMSCALTAMAVHEMGGRAVSLTGSQAGLITDGSHGSARLREIRPRRILDALDDGQIVLVAGFQGRSAEGDVTTLGRGGSDSSAVALATALGLRCCEIFTDVAGVFTADPRVVPSARTLTTLSHGEMLELAYGGAAVLQPRCVELARTHEVDIHVRSTFSAGNGTWVRKQEDTLEKTKITGVAHRRHERLYAVRTDSPAVITSALSQRGVTIGTLMRHEGELRFTAPGGAEGDVGAALDAVGVRMDVCNNLGVVSVVGTGIASRPDIASRALAALERHGIDVQLLTSTSTRVSCHVSSEHADQAARVLHDAFGLHTADGD